MMCVMSTTYAKLVMVDANALDDLLELVRVAITRLGSEDDLTRCLRGLSADIRTRSLLEP